MIVCSIKCNLSISSSCWCFPYNKSILKLQKVNNFYAFIKLSFHAVFAVASHIRKGAQPLARCEWEAFSHEKGTQAIHFCTNLFFFSFMNHCFYSSCGCEDDVSQCEQVKPETAPILQVFMFSLPGNRMNLTGHDGFLDVDKVLGTVVLLLGP